MKTGGGSPKKIKGNAPQPTKAIEHINFERNKEHNCHMVYIKIRMIIEMWDKYLHGSRQRFELAQPQQRIPSVGTQQTQKCIADTLMSFKSIQWTGNPRTVTLFTIVTTESKISPLNGLKATHWYLTGNVTNPVPSRINPFPMLSIPVIAITKPCLPLQKNCKFYPFLNSSISIHSLLAEKKIKKERKNQASSFLSKKKAS